MIWVQLKIIIFIDKEYYFIAYFNFYRYSYSRNRQGNSRGNSNGVMYGIGVPSYRKGGKGPGNRGRSKDKGDDSVVRTIQGSISILTFYGLQINLRYASIFHIIWLQAYPPLKKMMNANVLLTLPGQLKVKIDIRCNVILI